MQVCDPIRFLYGDREAILRIAGSWWSVLVGLLLVLSAGIARNYDHLSLLHEMEWIYGPIVASLVSAAIVYVLGMWRYARAKGAKWSFLSFISIYWMTAPCAWLYGIPVEAFTDIYTATQWNIAFLAIVATWRVVLITRCLVVLTGDHWLLCLIRVMLPASLVAFVASFLEGISLVGIMGGVRLDPHVTLLADAANVTCAVSLMIFITCCLSACCFYGRDKESACPLPWRSKIAMPKRALATAVTVLLLGGIVVLPVQLKVQRNYRLKQLIAAKAYREAVEYASQFEAHDFNRIHHMPPAPLTYSLHDLLEATDASTPQWLIDEWQGQLEQWVKR